MAEETLSQSAPDLQRLLQTARHHRYCSTLDLTYVRWLGMKIKTQFEMVRSIRVVCLWAYQFLINAGVFFWQLHIAKQWRCWKTWNKKEERSSPQHEGHDNSANKWLWKWSEISSHKGGKGSDVMTHLSTQHCLSRNAETLDTLPLLPNWAANPLLRENILY